MPSIFHLDDVRARPVTPDQATHATHIIAENSRDAADCRRLLDIIQPRPTDTPDGPAMRRALPGRGEHA